MLWTASGNLSIGTAINVAHLSPAAAVTHNGPTDEWHLSTASNSTRVQPVLSLRVSQHIDAAAFLMQTDDNVNETTGPHAFVSSEESSGYSDPRGKKSPHLGKCANLN